MESLEEPRGMSKEAFKKEQRRILKDAIVTSLAYVLVFTGGTGLMRLQSSLHREEGLGTITTSLLFIAQTLASLFLPKLVMSRLDYKWTMALSIVCILIWMVSNGYAVWATMTVSSVIAGFSGGLIFPVQGSFFSLLAHQYTCLNPEQYDTIIVRFFGIFTAIFQARGIFGAILMSPILHSSPLNESLVSLANTTFLNTCGANACPYKGSANPNLIRPDNNVVWILLGVFIALATIALVMIIGCVRRVPKELRPQGTKSCEETLALLSAAAKICKRKEALLLSFLTLYTGLWPTFYSADFCQAYVTCSLGIWMIGYVSISQGIVNIASSFGTAVLAKYTGQIPILISAFLIDLGVHVGLLLWVPHHEQTWVLFLLAALMGCTDGIWATHVSALYGKIFLKDKEAAFSYKMTLSSIGQFIGFAYSYFLCTRIKVYILTVNLLLGMSGYLMVEILRKRQEKSSVPRTTTEIQEEVADTLLNS